MKQTENSCRFPLGQEGKQMLAEMNVHHAAVNALTQWCLNVQNGDVVLDIGCGGGRVLRQLADTITHGKLYGVDYSETSVQCAQAENAAGITTGKVTVCLGDVAELPFPDAMFDKVYSIESYFFWPDLASNLCEIFRVVKPGGKVCIAENVMRREQYTDAQWQEMENYEMHPVSADVFAGLLKAAGFADVTAYMRFEEQREQLCMEAYKPQ